MQITATLKPNSKHREEVVAQTDGVFVIYVKPPAIEGRANDAAIKLLAKYLGVSKSSVRLVRGHTSKLKVFEIDDIAIRQASEKRQLSEDLVTIILPTINNP